MLYLFLDNFIYKNKYLHIGNIALQYSKIKIQIQHILQISNQLPPQLLFINYLLAHIQQPYHPTKNT